MHPTEEVLDKLVKPSAEIASQESGEPETSLTVNDGQRRFCLLARRRVQCLPDVSVSLMLSPCWILENAGHLSLSSNHIVDCSVWYSGLGCHCRELISCCQPPPVQAQEVCWFHAYNSALRELEMLPLWVGSHLWDSCFLWLSWPRECEALLNCCLIDLPTCFLYLCQRHKENTLKTE